MVWFCLVPVACVSALAANEVSLFYEVDGLVCAEAEHASHANLWRQTGGVSGGAMRAEAAGAWKGGVLRFDIEFKQTGNYALWLLAHRDSDAGRYKGNDIKVFLDRDLNQTENPTARNRSTDKMRTLVDGDGLTTFPDKQPESEINLGGTNIFMWHTKPKEGPEPAGWVIEKPGRHHIELVTGAEAGFVVDKIVLTRNNAMPPSGLGPVETSSPERKQPEPGLDENVVLPPAWAFGVLYGIYENQDGVLRTVDRLIEEGYPIDGIWIDSWFWDWGGDGPEGFIDFVGDRGAFPNPQYMWGMLRRQNVKAGLWVWDQIFKPGNEQVFEAFRKRGHFKRVFENPSAWHNETAPTTSGEIDFADPKAAAYWRQQMKPLFDAGVDFLKLDRSTTLPFCRTAFETTQELGLETGGRGFILSHKTGVSNPAYKRYPTKWSGDTKITWTQPVWPDPKEASQGGLKENIEMVANPRLYTYDIPFLTHDGGGFKEFDSPDLSDELYIRYCQFSCFNTICEIFASVTNKTANLPFNFSAQAQRAFRRYTHLRVRLFPYIYSYAHLTRQTRQKMIRGFHRYSTQYLFGDELLVAPVYEKGAQWRQIYLPEGRWIDYWRGNEYRGGHEILYDAPLERLPLLVRAGAIIPMRDYARAIELGSNDPLTLDIYPDGTSKFFLFEDDGTSNDYLHGGYAVTEFVAEQADTLAIKLGAALGAYTGQPDSRTYILKVNKQKGPAGVRLDGAPLAAIRSKAALDEAAAGYSYDATYGVLWVKLPARTDRDASIVVE
jgi:hypothetical protein